MTAHLISCDGNEEAKDSDGDSALVSQLDLERHQLVNTHVVNKHTCKQATRDVRRWRRQRSKIVDMRMISLTKYSDSWHLIHKYALLHTNTWKQNSSKLITDYTTDFMNRVIKINIYSHFNRYNHT